MTARPAKLLTWRRVWMLVLIWSAATLVTLLLCSLVGDMGWPRTMPVWQGRLTRLVGAMVVGAALAASGMALQGLLRNPLAEPYILGISSGSGIGVLLGLSLPTIFLRLGWAPPTIDWLTTPALALVGALVTCGTVYGIAQRRGRLNPYVLLLSGVIVNAFNGAVMLIIFLMIPPRTITDYTHWAMGGLSDATSPALLGACGLVTLAGWAMLLVRGSALNALGLGDEVAASSGVAVHWLRVETFVIVSLMTAASVALAGPVGFVGLIVPHIGRLVTGPDHRRLAIASGFAGAIALMLAQTLCVAVGNWLSLGVVPVGIVTALAGGPFFIYLLRQRGMESSR